MFHLFKYPLIKLIPGKVKKKAFSVGFKENRRNTFNMIVMY